VTVFIGTVATVVDFVAETPASDTLEVVTAKSSLRITFDGVTDLFCLVRIITTVVISIALPFRRNTDLQHDNRTHGLAGFATSKRC